MDDLRNKTVLITGGASGIGEATADLFAAHGARVIVADVQDELGNAVVQLLGARHRYVHLDVSKPEEWTNAVASSVTDLGGLDVLILNAAVLTGPAGAPIMDDPLQWMTPERINRILAVNMGGIVHGVVACLPELLKKADSTIMCVSSLAGISPWLWDPVYSMTKAGVIGFVRSMTPTLSPKGVRMLAVCPHSVQTAFMPPDLAQQKKDLGLQSSPPSHMAESILTIYKDAGPGEIWVGQADEGPYQYVPAPIRAWNSVLPEIHPAVEEKA